MWNSAILALLTHIHLIKKCRIYRFTLNKDFSVIWHNDSIMGNNRQYIRHCDVIKQPGETATAGWHYCFINEHGVGKVGITHLTT